MSSNQGFFALAISIVLAISSTGCDRFLKSAQSTEDKEKQKTVEISAKGLECLKVVPAKIRNYSEDSATKEEIDEVYACFQKAVNTFTLYTKGSSDGQYTGEELRHFFNRYFLKQNEISSAFMIEILKLKALIIGGSIQTVSRSELNSLMEFASVLRDQAQLLRGSFRLLLMKYGQADASKSEVENQKIKNLPEVDFATLARLRDNLRIATQALITKSKFAGSLYEFQDFSNFLTELNGFLKAKAEDGVTETVLQSENGKDQEKKRDLIEYLPLAGALKNLLIGERSQLRTMRDWQTATDWVVDVYFEFLNYKYRIGRWDYQKASTSAELVGTVDRVLKVLEKAPAFIYIGRMEASLIDRVIEAAGQVDLLKNFLATDTLKSTYRMLIMRLIDRDSKSEVQSFTGIEKRHLGILRFEFHVWQLAQESLTDIFEKSATPEATSDEVKNGLLATNVKQKIAQWPDVIEASILERTWVDWTNIVQAKRPLQWTLTGHISMVPDPLKGTTALKGLTIMNALRTAVRFAMRGYGRPGEEAVDPKNKKKDNKPAKELKDVPNIWDLQWAAQDLDRLEKEFHEAAIAFKFIDSRSANPAGRTFKEANFFTYAGDGNDWLTSQEIFEELNLLVAVGKSAAGTALGYAKAIPGCEKVNDPDDVFGMKKLGQQCTGDAVRAHFAELMDGLPKMTELVSKMNDDQWAGFYRDLIRVAGVKDRVEGTTEYSELRTALVVLHYVEGLMMTYDTNRDNRLQMAEIQAASPRFRNFIATQSPVGDFLVDDIFLYIVYKGKKPGLGDVADLIGFQFEKNGGLRDIDRRDLLNVLAILKEDASK